jgi:hypothetical protein
MRGKRVLLLYTSPARTRPSNVAIATRFIIAKLRNSCDRHLCYPVALCNVPSDPRAVAILQVGGAAEKPDRNRAHASRRPPNKLRPAGTIRVKCGSGRCRAPDLLASARGKLAFGQGNDSEALQHHAPPASQPTADFRNKIGHIATRGRLRAHPLSGIDGISP